METHTKLPARNSAFSLIELLIVVATIAVIGAVAVGFISQTNTTLTASKLEKDVSSLNSAVKVFVSNGGSIDGITTAQDLVTELKKSAANQRSVVGLRNSMVDVRLQAIEETAGEVRERAVWKPALGKFVIETSTDGVREFVMNDALSGVDYATAARETKLVYNDVDGWVWETADRSFTTGVGPQSLPTLNAPTLGARGGSGAANSSRLFTPVISPDAGTLALASFPLQVTIGKSSSDPQDATVQYSIEPNTWLTYSGPFYVEPGTTVQAFTAHSDPSWESSEAASAIFNNSAETLEIALSIPKNPLTFAEAGGALEPGNYTPVAVLDPITITLPSTSGIPDKYENSDNFRVYWTYDGSDPLTASDRRQGSSFTNGYAGDSISYTLPVWDGAPVLPIQIVAKSSNTTLVTNSNVHTANININVTDLPAPTASYNDTNTSRGDTVELVKMVDSGDMPVGARIYYTTDGTDPGNDGSGNPLTGTLYTGSFDPLVGDGLAIEKQIVARVYPPAEYAAWFNVSDSIDIDYEVPSWEISGTSGGWFSNPEGPGGMVSNFTGNGHSNNGHGNNIDGVDSSNPGQGGGGPNGQIDLSGDVDDEAGNGNGGGKNKNKNKNNGNSNSNSNSSFVAGGDYFQWGTATDSVGANSLQFNGSSFENVTANERFQVGTLDYFNGTISMNSVATGVDFAIDLDFGGNSARFDYSFDLLTTPNVGNVWQNADYVWFNNNGTSAKSINLAGRKYALSLEFGETSQYGSSQAAINQFHVQEGRSASAAVYARLQAISMF